MGLSAFQRDTYALPLDLFRVAAGLLSFAYFLRLLADIPDFSSPHGLLDHELLQQIFWFTRLSLFQPGIAVWSFYVIFSLACAGAWGIVLGYRIKLCAGVLFAIAVSTYRWNFIVMYVDDAIMHLMLFWLLILPVGQTLTVTEWWRTGRSCWTRWRRITVPGMSVYCFLGNICLIYLVAGLWKFESPLWRDGFAVYVTLNMPIAHTPEMWGTPSLPWLRAANYMVLFIEPLLPLLFMLRCGHPLKWLGLVCQLGFHIGILATLNIPFANLAMLATAVLFFRDEIMRGLCRRLELPPLLCRPQHHQWLSRLACGVLVLLMFSMTSRFSTSKVTYIPAAAALWMMGIAQEYQLFNWIDEKNYTNRYDVRITQADGQEWTAPSDALLPPSLRASVIQGYLYDVNWIKLDDAYRPALKRSILTRMAQRFCRHHPLPGRISVQADLQRVLPPHVVPQHAPPRFVMSFECAESKPVLCQTMVDPEMACPSMSDSLLHMATGH